MSQAGEIGGSEFPRASAPNASDADREFRAALDEAWKRLRAGPASESRWRAFMRGLRGIRAAWALRTLVRRIVMLARKARLPLTRNSWLGEGLAVARRPLDALARKMRRRRLLLQARLFLVRLVRAILRILAMLVGVVVQILKIALVILAIAMFVGCLALAVYLAVQLIGVAPENWGQVTKTSILDLPGKIANWATGGTP